MPKTVLLISGGHAEDLIGATLTRHLEVPVQALPLVGSGKTYHGAGVEVLGPHLEFPSGGFPFNSLENLVADLRAGLIQKSLGQWMTSYRKGKEVGAVAVVGDAYSLFVGVIAARSGGVPLFHLQPQISHYYVGNRSVWERLRQFNQFGAEDYLAYERWMHRYVRAVYVRDKLSEQRARQLGMHKARFVGSMAMDTLGPPERDLRALLDGRAVLVMLPGTRADVRYSLPRMLEAAALLPEFQGLVAWALPFEQASLPPGWRLEPVDELTALACNGEARVWLLRRAFSAILHRGRVAIGTAGTANEQAAGMGIPVVGFPTRGPQYLPANALRQQRLLGAALHLVEARPEAIAALVRRLSVDGPLRQAAQRDGLERNGPPGALPQIAREIRSALGR
ncbi:MAG TPA: lipid-A-disaccharide synthase-related protein [Meiothermus sp.]|nr:lipid-A-disaccharide synthase-related protein [Meiothermus sp.]